MGRVSARGQTKRNSDSADGRGLVASGLSKSWHDRAVLVDVTLQIARGQSVLLLGPNGAGKTTCFSMICGLLPIRRGTVSIDGRDATALPMHRRARLGLGYLPQEESIFRGLSTADNIMAILEFSEPDRRRRAATLERLLDEFDLQTVRRSRAVSLSGGERRRLEIARLLSSDPAYALLDEPLAGVDPISVDQIRSHILHLKKKGLGVLITDHNARDALSLADYVYVLYSGRVISAGRPAQIVKDDDVRRVYLGKNFRL